MDEVIAWLEDILAEFGGKQEITLQTERLKEMLDALIKDRGPTKDEIQEEMELHNADEAGIDNQWTLEDAEYHLLLSDKYHKPEQYKEKDGAK
jgi:hypothetical protein